MASLSGSRTQSEVTNSRSRDVGLVSTTTGSWRSGFWSNPFSWSSSGCATTGRACPSMGKAVTMLNAEAQSRMRRGRTNGTSAKTSGRVEQLILTPKLRCFPSTTREISVRQDLPATGATLFPRPTSGCSNLAHQICRSGTLTTSSRWPGESSIKEAPSKASRGMLWGNRCFIQERAIRRASTRRPSGATEFGLSWRICPDS